MTNTPALVGEANASRTWTSTGQVSEPVSSLPAADSEAAALALIAVLEHPDFRTKMDERMFEALLLYALRRVSGFGNALFGCGAGVEYGFGRRRREADVVGWRDGHIVVECEVKIRSLHNWQKKAQVWQLDAYAYAAPASAQLFLLTRANRVDELKAEFEQHHREVRSRKRWAFLDEQNVVETVSLASGLQPGSDGPVQRLVRAVARLVDNA